MSVEIIEAYEKSEMESLESRVDKGEKWLDKRFPGWEKEVDPDLLAMSSASVCMLGQLGGKHPTEIGLEIAYEAEGVKYAYNPNNYVSEDEARDYAGPGDYGDVANFWESRDPNFDPKEMGFLIKEPDEVDSISYDNQEQWQAWQDAEVRIYSALTELWQKRLMKRVEAANAGDSA